jgi:PleD family two-component response regulator
MFPAPEGGGSNTSPKRLPSETIPDTIKPQFKSLRHNNDAQGRLKGNDVHDAVEVFVVDDNVDAADALSILINGLGHKAAAFYDGESAIRASRLGAPLCVFLDVNMAGMNGL